MAVPAPCDPRSGRLASKYSRRYGQRAGPSGPHELFWTPHLPAVLGDITEDDLPVKTGSSFFLAAGSGAFGALINELLAPGGI